MQSPARVATRVTILSANVGSLPRGQYERNNLRNDLERTQSGHFKRTGFRPPDVACLIMVTHVHGALRPVGMLWFTKCYGLGGRRGQCNWQIRLARCYSETCCPVTRYAASPSGCTIHWQGLWGVGPIPTRSTHQWGWAVHRLLGPAD